MGNITHSFPFWHNGGDDKVTAQLVLIRDPISRRFAITVIALVLYSNTGWSNTHGLLLLICVRMYVVPTYLDNTTPRREVEARETELKVACTVWVMKLSSQFETNSTYECAFRVHSRIRWATSPSRRHFIIISWQWHVVELFLARRAGHNS